MNQQDRIDKLKLEIKELEKSLIWYKETYEKRRLAGIVKDRLKIKYNKTNLLGANNLEKRIKSYILSNPLTVKSNPKTECVSIIMLSYNRIEDTKKAVESIYKYTSTPFELIILDNNSTDLVRAELTKLPEKYKNLKVILETVNLGCAKGRTKATRYAKYDYLLFLDNDIIVSPYYLENLFSILYKDDAVAGVCCKVVFPDGNIQFNGGKMICEDQYALYSLHHEGISFDDERTNQYIDCEWIPGGATLWRRKIFENFGIDNNMKGSFEDNEVSYRLKNAGYKLCNSPASIVIHDHYDYKSTLFKKNEAEYFAQRNNQVRIKEALLHFYNKHNLIFSFAWKNNPWDIIWNLNSKEQIIHFINENSQPK